MGRSEPAQRLLAILSPMCLIISPITIPVALPAAYAFARLSFPGGQTPVFPAFNAFPINPRRWWPLNTRCRFFRCFPCLVSSIRVTGIALAHCLFNLPGVDLDLAGPINRRRAARDGRDGVSSTGYSPAPATIWENFLLPQIAPGKIAVRRSLLCSHWVEVVFAPHPDHHECANAISMALSAMSGFHTDIGMVMERFHADLDVAGGVAAFCHAQPPSRGSRSGGVPGPKPLRLPSRRLPRRCGASTAGGLINAKTKIIVSISTIVGCRCAIKKKLA